MPRAPRKTVGERVFDAPYDLEFHPQAIYAMVKGEATPQQQIEGMAWIITVACASYEQTFVPGDPHATSFMAGRTYAGQQIIKLQKMNARSINKAKQ